MCHSDVGLLEDEKWMVMWKRPSCPDEIAGEIVEVGWGVDGWSVGDRVMIWSISGDAPVSAAMMASVSSPRPTRNRSSACLMVRNMTRPFLASPGMRAYSAVVIEGQLKAGQKVGIRAKGRESDAAADWD
ncbi:alcohol dehydrogenase catalytic domain-containing protein [Pseudarthrobacter sp. fls2-241-R2A-168]|uniref:alcohol dehydrogenase catalytic domain-containing protein n=1 Tax=Pseudarthrobacter sp. fls2-241-R2A-168 TaxID=3040304 RepID=UPI00255281C3|nr:alcohol dehydrogenase catalytic domain-containing protein [Pseudarthrobacter sp. fls2-241-R2A-168]